MIWKWNIIWFNPPFSRSASTKVTKTFLQLVILKKSKKNFPRNKKLHKIFNLNTVKGTNIWRNNMSQIIKEHNEKVTSKPRDQTPKSKLRKKSRMSNEREPSS